MAIMDILRRNVEKTAKFKEAQENRQIENKLNEREKSADERELERFHEEERMKSIKRNLEEFRKAKQKQDMATTVLGGKNMFKGKGNMMTDKSEVMQNNNRLFTMKQGSGGRQMFFK